MTKLNVVDLGSFKEQRELRKAEQAYKSYLETLGNSQLEVEVNHLLEEFSADIYGKDFFSKGQLILKEISSRAHPPVKAKIDALTTETLRLI